MKKELYKYKYYIALLGALFILYIYAGATGWKFFGSNTEKWEPEQQKGYHK